MINPGKRPIRRRRMSYNTWANRMALKWGISREEFESDPYDYRTYYKENYTDAQRHLKEDWHFPDTYKLPDHPTFSIDARASGKKNRINPKGVVGGEWENDERGFDRYQFSNSQINNGWDIMRTIDYVEDAEENGVSVRMPNGQMPRLSNGDLYDAVLPTATVRPRHYAGGKDDEDPDNYPLYVNGRRYLVSGNYTYDLGGNRVRFQQGGGILPEAVVTPSARQRLDHPLIWKDVVNNLYVNTPEEKAIRNTTPTTEALSALTGGAVNLNRLSASQNLRLGYDLLTGNFEDAGRGLVYGNSGLVSKKFEEEHPYWSMAINGATDMAGGLATVAAINRAKFPIATWRPQSLRPRNFEASTDGMLMQNAPDPPDLLEEMYYKLMVRGENVNPSFPGILNGQLNDRVTKGLSPSAISDLMHNTVERNLQTWAQNAASDMPTAVADAYRTAAREALEDINIGRYPALWYKKADKGNVLGFKTDNSNGPFISLRDDLRPSRGVEQHEGEHLLNDMVAGVGEDNGKFLGQWYSNIIRNPMDYIHRGLKNALERGVRVPGSIVDDQVDNVRAAVRAIDRGTGFLDDIIKAAYDLDFLDIPKWVEKLKGYKNMASERVTTNRDARKQLFNRFNAFMKKQNGDAYDDISSMPIEHLNELIDTLPDQWILDAVKNSNGYGQAYMHFLKKNKKITTEKIKLFRDAMKYVGVYGVPLTVGATLFNEE